MTPTITDETSMADIRAVLGGKAAPQEPKPETSEPAAAEQHPEAVTEPAETKQEPIESEEPLPEGVKKRIAKEAEKAARIQSEIDRAVSNRKAKEAELEKLKTDAPGSQPVTTAQATEKPKRPVYGETGHDNETWGQFEERQALYEDARDKWLKADAIREFQETQTTEQTKARVKQAWDAAVEKHGKDGTNFQAAADTVVNASPEGLQLAISALDNWDGVTIHLANHPATLKELAAKYATNPYAAVATLGRIEAALTKKEPAPATTEKSLPEPIAKVGGSASVSGQDLQTALENGSMSKIRAIVKKARGA